MLNSLSFSYFNPVNFIKGFIQPESFKQKDIYPKIVSVKSKLEVSENPQNIKRSTWYFLTLGIPKLIESLSLFFSDILHRHTSGITVKIRFKSKELPQDKINCLMRFHRFNELNGKPLNEAAKNKVTQLMMKKIKQSKKISELERRQEIQENINKLQQLIEKNIAQGMTRAYFNESDWQIADLIEFELIEEYFQELIELFNAKWMSHSTLRKELQTLFDFDYQEAVVAESLALSLAYIENIEGKILKIPVFNSNENKYCLTSYKISMTYIGDALPCYILESEDPKASDWFVVRGTQPYIKISSDNLEYRTGGLESLFADSLDPECISRNLINKSLSKRPIRRKDGVLKQYPSMSDFFLKNKRERKKANLAGHSLGGTVVNSLAVEFYDQIKTAYAFSPTGVSHKTANRWNHFNEIYPELKLNQRLVNFDYDGDMIPSGGRRLIGNHLAIKALAPLWPVGIYHSHVRSHLNGDFQIQKIDIERETHKWARVFCEYLRIIVGRCFLFLLSIFSQQYIPDWWKNRKIYKEAAEHERKIRPFLI